MIAKRVWRLWLLFVVLAAGLVGCAAPAAVDKGVYGLTLGEPMPAWPSCDVAGPREACIMNRRLMALDHDTWPGENWLLDIDLRRPEIAAKNAMVMVLGGQVHIISLNVVDAPAVLAQLEKSLGVPDEAQGADFYQWRSWHMAHDAEVIFRVDGETAATARAYIAGYTTQGRKAWQYCMNVLCMHEE